MRKIINFKIKREIMCGIVGYIGTKQSRHFVIKGLGRLEYRGYDSAGFACIGENDDCLDSAKIVGRVVDLEKILIAKKYKGCSGVGHTRWATHGVANKINSHPHFDCSKKIAVVHNGIIEEHEKIRSKLIAKGHRFHSDTDTEVAAHLLEDLLKNCLDIKSALFSLTKILQGAYSLVFLMNDNPDQLILVRRRSPLVVGVGKSEMFVASDFLAFSDKTQEVVFLPDESIAFLRKNHLEVFDFKGTKLNVQSKKIEHKFSEVEKHGFEHYMIKEIYEQKKAIHKTVSHFNLLVSRSLGEGLQYKQNLIWDQLGVTLEEVKKLKKVNLVAAGTSWHACRIAQFFVENICKIPAHVHLASEFRHMPFFKEDDSIFIFVSQSGETADTLEALRLVKSFNVPTITLTNVASSTMVRETNGFLHMQAGPEIAVASTKAFSCQLSSLFWLANQIALGKKLINSKDMQQAESDLFIAAQILEDSIENYKDKISEKLAEFYSKYDKFIFLGRHINYPFAMEAALKLKEISYIFSQCYPAGELKHGPIALIDSKTPVVLFSTLDDLIYQKLVSNAQEVKARKGHLLVFAFDGQEALINLADNCFVLPKVNPLLTPLAMTGLMQFFVYQITKVLGCPIDKPRNLAKSVTVE